MKDLLQMALYGAYQAQRRYIRPDMAKIGLSVGQPKVLDYLMRHDGCLQKEIAQALDIEPATVSQLLVNMEQTGLIRRADPAKRKRAESVSITEKGAVAYEQWRALCLQVEGISLKGFTEEERATFLEYLARMYRNLTGKSME